MSGTSLDGIDAALVEFGDARGRLVGTHLQAFSQPLRARALSLNSPQPDELHLAALTANDLARAYADAVAALLAATGIAAGQVTAIGCHGQTIRHRPDCGY